MDTKRNQEISVLIKQAIVGDKAALETVLKGVQDMVFNLSLRMLGTFPDAEDASQDILLKVMTHLSSFKGESEFSTWVFRIAVNHLTNYKKHMFAQFPLSFEFYGNDIKNGKMEEIDGYSHQFAFCKTYQSPERLKQFVRDLLNGSAFSTVTQA